MKKILVFALALVAGMATFADWTYDTTNKLLSDGSGWVLAVTASGNNLTVTGVDASSTGAGALDLSQAIDGGQLITAIGDYAFYKNTDLTSATLPTTLTSIGQGAFGKCSNLTTVTPFLPDSVTSIGQIAFVDCTALEGDLTLGRGGSSLSFGEGWLWKGNPHGNVDVGNQFQNTKISSVTIGNGIKSFSKNIFRQCASLKTVVLGNAMTSISSFAFKNCSALETVTPFLPETLTTIGGGAFADCTKLKGVVRLGESVATFTFGTGSWDSNINYGCPFRNCSSLEGAVLGAAVKGVPDAAFLNNAALATVTMTDSVTSIGSSAFNGCASLQSVTLSQNLTSIGSSAFKNCSALKTVTPFLPETVTSVGIFAFNGCSKLEGTLKLGSEESEVSISMTENWDGGSYGGNEFAGTKITAIELGKGVKSLPSNVFGNCKSVTNVVFYGDVPTTFSTSTFNGCSNYQMYWLVPSVASWLTFGNDTTKVTPWDSLDAATQAKYEAFVGEGETAKGATVGFQKQFLAFQKAVVLDKLLAVVGEPSALGEVSPAYDDVPANVGENLPLAFSAPEYVENGNTLWRCTGYRIDTLVDTDWVEGTPVVALDGSYNVAEAGTQRLVWLWEKAGYKVSSIDLPEGMSMTASVQPSLRGYYPAGTVVTFTAVGDTFECWCGDIADATIDGNVITVTVNGEMEVSPYFALPWVINGTTMTDGYHVFNVSVNEELKEVSLTSFKENCKASILDFTKPVVGGYKIVSAPGFYQNGAVAALKECRFAGTIRSYGNYAYQGITFKMTIPEENDILTIGEGAFSGASGLTGPIVLPKATAVSTFSGTSITSLDLNKNLTWVPTLNKNGALERVVIRYPGDSLTFSKYWRQSCPKLKEIVFYGAYNPAGITEGWNYGARTGTNVRYLVPFATDPSWQALANQDAIDAKTFTPWKQCTAAQTNAYWTTFGADAKRPIGYTTVPGGAWIVELQEPATLLILK